MKTDPTEYNQTKHDLIKVNYPQKQIIKGEEKGVVAGGYI
jgi:hypothetical protein